jgi:hypothetical protein
MTLQTTINLTYAIAFIIVLIIGIMVAKTIYEFEKLENYKK